MKSQNKNWIYPFFIIGLLLISAICCKKDPCDKTIEPQYEVGIRVVVELHYDDGTPCNSYTAAFDIQKTHCDGSKGQKFEAEGLTDAAGRFTAYITYNFKMNNSKDYIEIHYYGGDKIGGGYEEEGQRIFYYNDLKQYANDIMIVVEDLEIW